jgi:hypothetical protein
METVILFFIILVIFLYILIKKKEHFTNRKYIVSYTNNGEWGLNFLKKILPKIIKNKQVIFKQVKYPDLVIESVFKKKEIVKKKNYKFITISGESYNNKNYKKALFNILSIKSEDKKDIWRPHICWGLDNKKIDILKNKKFKKINERKNFLIYMAKNCVSERELFFKLISKRHKGCHAAGKCSNNIKLKNDKGRLNFSQNKDIFNNYKFVLCMENKIVPGYITEKIINAYLGGAIPIYWGDSKSVNYFFNPDSFININNFNRFNDCIDYILELNKNPEKMLQMQQINIFKDGKINDMFLDYQDNNPFINRTINKLNKLNIKF